MSRDLLPSAGTLGPDAQVKQLDDSWVNTSVSWGTMRDEDLVPAFCDVIALIYPEKANAWLREYRWYAYRRDQAANHGTGVLMTERDQEKESNYQEKISWLLNETIWNTMQDIAPDGCTFSSHPGDGSDYGFWQTESDDDDTSED